MMAFLTVWIAAQVSFDQYCYYVIALRLVRDS